MRSKFRGHFSETQETIDELWQKATFVFDANVLLNLYRYSDSARNEFLTFLSKISERCWLPEQCAWEFLDNRANVIKDQIKSYDDTIKAIGQIRTKFEGNKAHPFISDVSFEGLNAALASIERELSDGKDGQIKRITQDHIKEEIADIFDESVGDPLSDDELEKLFENGKSRYEEKTPPGYMDLSKHKDLDTMFARRSRYGDLIWWKQAIQKAKSDRHSLIVVTDDQKEDWWEIVSGKTVGPRPELISEFCTETDQQILIYSPESFLRNAKQRLKGGLSAQTIKEVKTEHDARAISSNQESASKFLQWLKTVDGQSNDELDFIDGQPKGALSALFGSYPNKLTLTERKIRLARRLRDQEIRAEKLLKSIEGQLSSNMRQIEEASEVDDAEGTMRLREIRKVLWESYQGALDDVREIRSNQNELMEIPNDTSES